MVDRGIGSLVMLCGGWELRRFSRVVSWVDALRFPCVCEVGRGCTELTDVAWWMQWRFSWAWWVEPLEM